MHGKEFGIWLALSACSVALLLALVWSSDILGCDLYVTTMVWSWIFGRQDLSSSETLMDHGDYNIYDLSCGMLRRGDLIILCERLRVTSLCNVLQVIQIRGRGQR